MRKLGFSFVRLLPKETGVRPIVNLSRRKPLFRVRAIDILLLILTESYKLKGRVHAPLRGDNAGQSINQVLQAALEILKFEKVCQRNGTKWTRL